MTLTELLAQYDVDEDDLTAELDHRMRTRPAEQAADLTGAEESFWHKHAGLPMATTATETITAQSMRPGTGTGPGPRTGPGPGTASVLRDEVVAMADQLATSLTIEQAATALGVDRTRIPHRIRQRELYAYRLGRQQRLPRGQFQVSRTTTQGLPGLAQVLEVLPDGLHPLSVEGFFTTSDPDLGGSTPRDWLLGGGDPAVVAQEAATLDRW